MADPQAVLNELDRLDSEASLRDFCELAWPILEPGRQFMPGWHIDAICEHLEAVSRGDIIRLNINIPPGCMKSLLVDALWPAWEWGPRGRPDLRYVSASYSQDLTIRNNRRMRAIIGSPWYQAKWGHLFKIAGDQNAKTRFDNDHMGFKIATSVGGLGTGERGDRFIIDDGNNIKDTESVAVRGATNMWFLEVVPTRVNDPTHSAFVNIQQRTHEGDISGTIMERELGYVNLILPMEFEPERKCFVEVTGWSDPRTEENELLWPNRMTRAVVERDKQALGEYAVAGQFQQRPAPRGGGMFKRLWWNFYETGHPSRPFEVTDRPAVPLPKMDWIVISVDAAFKSTTTGSRVGMLAIGGKGALRFVLDNYTRPMTFGETCSAIIAMLKAHPTCSRVLVEDKANGPAIIDTLRNQVSGIMPVAPEGGKESRAQAIQPSVTAGQVYLPEGAPWVDDFITEFATFPSSAKDDQVDALSQALIFMTQGADVYRATQLGKL